MYLVNYDKDSGKVQGYYPLELKADYEEAGGIPEPNIQITPEQYDERFQEGKIAVVENNKFVIKDIPPLTEEELAIMAEANKKMQLQKLLDDYKIAELTDDTAEMARIQEKMKQIKAAS